MTRILLAAVAAVTLLAVAMPGAALGVGQILEVHDSGGNVDRRSGAIQPSAAQQTAVENMGATVRWNRRSICPTRTLASSPAGRRSDPA